MRNELSLLPPIQRSFGEFGFLEFVEYTRKCLYVDLRYDYDKLKKCDPGEAKRAVLEKRIQILNEKPHNTK